MSSSRIASPTKRINPLVLLLRFGRPHTIIATTVQVLTLFVMSGGLFQLHLASLGLLLITLLSCLGLNLFIVGLNQITDLEIDRINKPDLPIAAGLLSVADAWRLISVAAVLSLILALISSPILLITIVIIMLIGTAYSWPPLRLKRFPIAAAVSIAIARGLVSNVGVALHYQHFFGTALPVVSLLLLGVFFFGFAIVIALYKDLPDLAGDQMFHIETFTTRLGRQRVLTIGRLVLTATYLLPIGFGLLGWPHPSAIFLLVSHIGLIIAFWLVSQRVDLDNQQAIKRFYLFLWALFYSEFIILSIYETWSTL
ncbi:MAG: homogentisate phytyltransferase [Chloroflexaceae bacterium]|nr:homogentisate phytyltransferase [Chloroflexaceae bacterium]